MPHRLPSILSAPPSRRGRTWLTGGRVFDGRATCLQEGQAVLVEDGRIVAIVPEGEVPGDAREVVACAGRTIMPGLIDVHSHLYGRQLQTDPGAEPVLPGVAAHLLAESLRAALRMGITTMRDVGSYGDHAVEARQAMRYGAFRGPRVLTCGRIVSATGPGGRFFAGMYREADGDDQMRAAVREQVRRGADFIKVMTTGARSVELEDPDPAQLTRSEIETLVGEAHRLGYRVAAHAEGLAGTELAIQAGIDTIEHGMYLNQRPDLLARMAEAGQVLVPTFGCFYGVAGYGDAVGVPAQGDGGTDLGQAHPAGTWAPMLVELARYNLEQADRTLSAARDAGVTIAAGHDWPPLEDLGIELLRMSHHGLGAGETLRSATAQAAIALGLDDRIGTITPGHLADILVVEGDPLRDLALLRDPERIWLVLQLGEPVAGAALNRTVACEPSGASNLVSS